MKLNLSVSFLVSFVHLTDFAYAATTCSTEYASTSTKSVPTRSTTKTTTTTSTSTIYVGSTSTTTIPFTYTIVHGKKTTTVPTGQFFTPVISAPVSSQYTISSRPTRVRRAVVTNPTKVSSTSSPSPHSSSSSPAPKSTSKFPHKVDCTSVVSKTVQTRSTTTVVTVHYEYPTYTTTQTVPTSTAYAACAPDNRLTEFQGNVINTISGSAVSLCGTPEQDQGGISCVSDLTCCEGAQRNNYAGFEFYNNSYYSVCYWFRSGWVFLHDGDGESPPPVYFGNGPEDSGTYGGAYYG